MNRRWPEAFRTYASTSIEAANYGRHGGLQIDESFVPDLRYHFEITSGVSRFITTVWT
jgi:hypothetical protein